MAASITVIVPLAFAGSKNPTTDDSLQMTAYLLTDHILNLIAPAAFVALMLVLLARLFSKFSKSRRAEIHSFWAESAIIFVANLVVMIAGLVIFGNDGKMATYGALVIVAGICQWALRRA